MPNKVYAAPGTALSFKSSGGDATITPTSVANGAGRLSARLDRGSASQPIVYRWWCRVKTASSATVGRTLRLYLACSETSTGSVDTDGTFDETDQAVSTEDRYRNCLMLGVVQADQAATGSFVASGLVEIRARYVQIGFFNDLNAALSGTASDFECRLIPQPDEIQ